MQAIIVGLINFLSGCIDTIFPDLSITSELGTNVNSAVDKILELLRVVNFIIPVNQILTIIGIVILIKLFKFGIFCVNWIIDKITSVIP